MLLYVLNGRHEANFQLGYWAEKLTYNEVNWTGPRILTCPLEWTWDLEFGSYTFETGDWISQVWFGIGRHAVNEIGKGGTKPVSEARLSLIDWPFRTVAAQLQVRFLKSSLRPQNKSFSLLCAKLETLHFCRLSKYLRQKEKTELCSLHDSNGQVSLVSQKKRVFSVPFYNNNNNNIY